MPGDDRPPTIETAPRVVFPEDGARLAFDPTTAEAVMRWTGSPVARYTVEYDVGEGHLRTCGTVKAVGTRLRFGPLDAELWSEMAQFNPWRVRVYPVGRPNLKSDWITVTLVSPAGGW